MITTAKIGLIFDIVGVILISIDMLKKEVQINANSWLKENSSFKIKSLFKLNEASNEDIEKIKNLSKLSFLICCIIGIILYYFNVISLDFEFIEIFFRIILIYLIIICIPLFLPFSILNNKKFANFFIYLQIPIFIIIVFSINFFSFILSIFIKPISFIESKISEGQLVRFIGLFLILIGFFLQLIS